MRSSFAGLEVSKRSIQLSQIALDVTGNNLSNRETVGYTRQRLDQNSLYLNGGMNWMTKSAKLSLSAQGVDGHGVAQVRDQYLDKRYRDMSCYQSQYGKEIDLLSQMETMLDNFESDGMTALISDFKTALTQYATDSADNQELANVVRNQAYNITTMLKSQRTNLEQMKSEVLFDTRVTIDKTNDLLNKIADYNNAILGEYKATECVNTLENNAVSRYGPLELHDQQNTLIDELAGYANIHVDYNTNGTVNITMGGQKVVDGGKRENIYMEEYEHYGGAVLKFTTGERCDLQAGELKAYINVLSGNGPYASTYQNSEFGIPYYINSLDAFAESFAEVMNTANGCTDDDTSRAMFGSSEDEYDEFGTLVKRGAVNSKTIRISEEWMSDATMIGQVRNPETGVYSFGTKSDGTNSLDGTNIHILMDALEAETTAFGPANDYRGSFYGFMEFISDRLGENVAFIETQYDTATTTSEELLDYRASISGVSETEEGINMMSYQKWFNASSRMMTALDDCLNTIINSMGRCGL